MFVICQAQNREEEDVTASSVAAEKSIPILSQFVGFSKEIDLLGGSRRAPRRAPFVDSCHTEGGS